MSKGKGNEWGVYRKSGVQGFNGGFFFFFFFVRDDGSFSLWLREFQGS